jgi:hypothetical protein
MFLTISLLPLFGTTRLSLDVFSVSFNHLVLKSNVALSVQYARIFVKYIFLLVISASVIQFNRSIPIAIEFTEL